jgi:hypothetical protein
MTRDYKSLFAKYISIAKKDAYLITTKNPIIWIISKLGIRKDSIYKRRIEISKKIDALFNSTVKYGPFKGLKLSTESWWGSTDRASMLFGLYEKEVLDSLQNIPKEYTTFIDLGAADGYYGIGVLVNNLFEKSICYEISEEGRKTIRDNAQINKVQNKVEIRGKAKKIFYDELSSDILSKSVLLIDIEGSEFELVDKETFKTLNNSIVFIELHDWFFVDGATKLQKLKNDSISTHTITEITMGARDPSIFPELKKLHDNDRWIICSEGRKQLMTWLRFDPR